MFFDRQGAPAVDAAQTVLPMVYANVDIIHRRDLLRMLLLLVPSVAEGFYALVKRGSRKRGIGMEHKTGSASLQHLPPAHLSLVSVLLRTDI